MDWNALRTLLKWIARILACLDTLWDDPDGKDTQ